MATAHTSSRAQSKSRRINLRATERQEDLLRRAAELDGVSLTEFVLGAAVDRAEALVADRRWFALDDISWNQFVRLLDAPLGDTPRLEALAERPSPFTDRTGSAD